MEEVEETKCKGGARSNASRWKPANTKELATTGGRIVFAQTVLDSYRVDAREVEQCKYGGGGGERARIVDVVTELVRHVEVE